MGAEARIRGGALALALGLLLVAGAVGFAGYFFYCPCDRAPGGWLLGDVVAEPVEDWSFANDEPLCQIQVFRGGVWPHAINLNCMASEGRLYLSCAGCEGKAWSTAALAHPEARLRLGARVYPVRLTRVEDPAVLDEAWNARARKTGRGEGSPRQDGWWSFRVVFRDNA
ncbi:MAG: hypothetical protein RIC56_14525 [Pseudomonadales bacterium]